MALSNPQQIRALAVTSVLKSLGERTYILLDNYLMNVHGIFLSYQGSYSMDVLRQALEGFIGEKSTAVIMELTYIKMEELAEASVGHTSEA